MNEENGKTPLLVCKPTKWFIWRAVAVILMFSVFGVLFFKDGMWGYREKNLHFYFHEAFMRAGKQFQEFQNSGDFTERKWRNYVAVQKVPFPADATQTLPRDTNLEMAWPVEIRDGYALMNEKGGQTAAARLWEDYSGERKWNSEVIDKAYTYGKIREQFIALGVTGSLAGLALFFLIRTIRREISLDDEALYSQESVRIPYEKMVRVDKRKWDTKGIALVHYDHDGVEKTAKIDGMVYGQFKEEDGAPAEKLLAHVMQRFKGEVIEYVDEEDDQNPSSAINSNKQELS